MNLPFDFCRGFRIGQGDYRIFTAIHPCWPRITRRRIAMQGATVAIPSTTADRRTDLFRKAQELETAFLSEMLRHAGLSKGMEGVAGGGTGEEQFASFLREAQAQAMVKGGGIGLAERLFESLARRDGA
jgi:Rod binding domain-containing protein